MLVLVAKGFTAREIADEIFVSLNTVETHRRNIVQKMNARNTAQAVAIAVRKNMI